jgi:predicted flap endonuclease-1-like 5' DNA nuclease
MILGIFNKCDGSFDFMPLLFLLGAFLLGWLLKHLLGGGGGAKIDVDSAVSAAVDKANGSWSSKYQSLEAELKKFKASSSSAGIVANQSLSVDADAVARWKEKATSLEARTTQLKSEKDLIANELNSSKTKVTELNNELLNLKKELGDAKQALSNQPAPMAAAAPAPPPAVVAPKDDSEIASEYEAKIAAFRADLGAAEATNRDIRDRLHAADKKNTELELRIKTASEIASKANALEARVKDLEANAPKDNSAEWQAKLDAANKKLADAEAANKNSATEWQSKLQAAETKATDALAAKASAEANAPKDNSAEWQAKLDAANKNLADANTKYNALDAEWKAKWDALQAEKAAIPMAAAAPKADDLTKIEGVGPAIAKLLNDKGMYTFADVANGGTAKIQEALDAGGERFKMHNPMTWAQQAALARDGNWTELKRWQEEDLDGGIPKEAAPKDDLTKIEGIGPAINGLLNDAKIFSFNQLSKTSVGRLKEILEAAGERFKMHDPSTWPQQAGLAKDGNWDALQKLQDELKGGRIV